MNKDSEVERKLKAVQEMEVEVMELKRKNRELQHEKRELTIKLDSAEARISALSNMTEVSVIMVLKIGLSGNSVLSESIFF